MPYYEKRIYSGKLLEVYRYFGAVKGGPGQCHSRENETTDQQKQRNETYARKKLQRLMNVNFEPGKDLFVTLTHPGGTDEQTARKAIKNYIDRLRRWRRKNGLPELKYIVITEKQAQWHHHLIMSAMPMETVFELWGDSRTRKTISTLDDSQQYKDLVKYLVAEEKPSKRDDTVENAKEPRKKNARRWSGSRNLKKPTVTPPKEIKRETILRRNPTAPRGYRLLPDWIMGCDAWGNLYQSFACEKIDCGRPTTKHTGGKKTNEQDRGRGHVG